MIPHIFKKDVRLLWRMALGVALVNALRTVLSSMSHNTLSRNLPVEKLASTFMSVAALATGLLIVMVVQTDALAGLRQDWLARPIKRADLVFSKLLFIVLLVQLPIFIADVCQGLAAGLPVGAVIGAAASRSVYLFLALDLPVFAFATLTRNLMEALGAALAVALAVGLIMVAAPAATSSSGIGWIADTMQLACELAGVALVAGLQYYRRRTARSWWITGSVVAVAMATQLLPWQQAFAVQERLSTAPSETLPVHIQLDNPSNRMFLGSAREGQAMVMVPLTLIGVAADEKLIEDRATARLVGSEGVFAEPTTGYDQGRALGLPFSQYLRLEFPAGLVGRLRRQPSRLEVDYSLTLERAVEHASLPVEAAPELVPGLGRCATGTNFAASAVELHCKLAGRTPCVYFALQGPEGHTYSRTDICSGPDYSPWFDHIFERDALSSVNFGFTFRPPSQLGDPALTEADEAALKSSRLNMTTYRPVAHFTRRVVVPDFQLNDVRSPWTR